MPVSQTKAKVSYTLSKYTFRYILHRLFIAFASPSRYERKLRAATTLSFGNQAEAILSKRELVPNTNRHALEGSNPVWMSGVGYDNYNYKGADLDEDDDEDEGLPNSHDNDDDMVERRNNLNGVVSEGGRRNHLESLDSLDANVLNDTYISAGVGGGGAGGEFEERSNGGSTIRMSATTANGGKMLSSTRSSSSGLGSGTARSRLSKIGGGIYAKNMTISALFPSQMPPVEKLNGGGEVGKTVYDEDDVPRTEL